MTPRPTHVLFDFFGTLVSYSSSRTEQGYHGSHALVAGWGAQADYTEFLELWAVVSERLDRACDADHSEFSMTQAGTHFLTELLGRVPTEEQVAAFVERYVAEWNTGVRYLPEIIECLHELSRHFRLAVVTNTHQADLVPRHLAAMGLLSTMDTVVTSVELGVRKPHPEIYATALRTLGIQARDAIFVGDTYAPDYTGPEQAGITAYLIDPDRRQNVPEERRLGSVLDLPARLLL